MKVLVTGITSIHGWPIYRHLAQFIGADSIFGIRPPKMKTPHGPNTAAVCITDVAALTRIRDDFKPTHVVHCSGVCDLDVCEERPAWARLLNTDGTKAVARVFGESAHILYFSTDLVFSGEQPPEGGYTEESVPDPISVAGATFAAAEAELEGCLSTCIVRLGLPIGPSITGDKGAFDWIASRLRKARPVTLFTDEWRSVVDCSDIAALTLFLLRNTVTGVWHCGGPKPTTLYEVGAYVARSGGYRRELVTGILRSEEKNGPPRIGNVALCSEKVAALVRTSLPTLHGKLTKRDLSPCSNPGDRAGLMPAAA